MEKEALFRYKNHPSAKYRFGMIDGKITKFPYSLTSALRFKKIDKIAFAKGLLKNMEISDDISMYGLIQQRFGEEAAKYLIDPMCRGIFGKRIFYFIFFMSGNGQKKIKIISGKSRTFLSGRFLS